ncbi:signal peptidase I [Blautia liquoris]|uniref:Signal peptidase I n=1 Tax=Blautia liquoris TaxID=2779518 RepID=A0A7M2RCR6_9FIRM|nr:signal peptidase I [Blautia liquoris]QOV18125.1 signal peptidase I [Blautia liquoris]
MNDSNTGKKEMTVQQPSLLREFLLLLAKIAVVILAVVLLFTFVYGLHRNRDPAMDPAVKDGDLVIYYRLDKHYVFGDTLMLDYQGSPEVRRVVGTAGDTVDIREDGLYINGARQQEASIHEPTHRYETDVDFPLTLKEGQVFVLGDARENATDSRVYGPVEAKETRGKVISIFRRRNI